jgi:NAD-specific glutamate dehydrogenase
MSHKHDQEASQSQDAIVQNILQELPENDLLRQYAEVYLSSVPLRVLRQYSTTEHSDFIQERFEYFLANYRYESITESGSTYRIVNIERTNTTIFELVAADAKYQLITLEAVLRKIGLRIIYKLYPILGVETDDEQNITSFIEAGESTKNYSHIYILIEEIDDEEVFKQLRESIRRHLLATWTVHNQYSEIKDALHALTTPLRNNTLPSTESLEEWEALLEWFNANFSFSGYVPFHHTKQGDEWELKPDIDKARGLLCANYLEVDENNTLGALQAHSWRLRHHSEPYNVDSVKVLSPFQRFENLLRISIKIADGENLTEHVFIGLLRQSSAQAKNTQLSEQKCTVSWNVRRCFQDHITTMK